MAAQAFPALLAEKLPQYRSSFEQACSGLFGGGASVVLEYEDDGDDGATPWSPSSSKRTEPARVGDEDDPTLTERADSALVRRELEGAVTYIADDFAQTFNHCLAERAQLEPDANAVMNRYEFGPQHVSDIRRALTAQLAPLLKPLERGDVDGARRASLDAWLPLERCIKEKWQAYFILTFQDVSVEIRANRDRRRHQSGRIDLAAAEAVASRPPAALRLSDFDAPDQVSTRALRSPWLALLALLAVAAVGGWLLTRSHGGAPGGAAGARP